MYESTVLIIFLIFYTTVFPGLSINHSVKLVVSGRETNHYMNYTWNDHTETVKLYHLPNHMLYTP